MGSQMPRSVFRAFSFVVVLTIWALPSVAKQSHVLLTINLPRTGCAAVSPTENIYVSAWPADGYPGDGRPYPTEYSTKTAIVKVNVTPGYYRIMYSTQHCWEAFQDVVLLPEHQREITVTFATWVAKGTTDYSVYYLPRGAIAGLIRANIDRVTLESLSEEGSRAPEMTALISQGAFYFESLPPGHYRLHIYSLEGKTSQDVIVHKDTAQILDLTSLENIELQSRKRRPVPRMWDARSGANARAGRELIAPLPRLALQALIHRDLARFSLGPTLRRTACKLSR